MYTKLKESKSLPEHVRPSPLMKIQQLPVDVASGMVTGVTITGAFHPFDRALYLEKRPYQIAITKKRVYLEKPHLGC